MLGLVGTWVAKPFVCFMLTGMAHGYASGNFDEEAWRRNWSAAWCWRCTPVRMAMAPQIAERGRLIGRSRTEIVELLNEPDGPTDLFHCVSPDGKSTMLWYLAPSMTDSFWLVVELDANDVAVRAAVQED
jgi:hypothetical protein